ncbi:hypothetical protein PV05_02566 [Exophiala xenobiotica]|uniref:YCII-related domain-containing protein n=1 Tax=Exophiala xenobiotica TaxID=348802 RepID=A0A0D2FDA5_9EURO|nr:uncharacterized protein PV05_02566 [Exophiala xenobiotica]KIW58014.1 hypothetical protein PV05_02566 [Exophiala xenobiotica]
MDSLDPRSSGRSAKAYESKTVSYHHVSALSAILISCSSHLEGLKPRIDSGIWVMGGATLSAPPGPDGDKQFNGSCVIAKARSKEEVLQELSKDVYAREGIWNLDKVQIHPVW